MNRKLLLALNILIGIIIALVPVIITGHWYDPSAFLDGAFSVDYILRTISMIIGLLVISNSLKNYYNIN